MFGTGHLASSLTVNPPGTMNLESCLHGGWGGDLEPCVNRFPRFLRGADAYELESLKAEWSGDEYLLSRLGCR